MQIDWIYRDAMPVGTSATSLMLTRATLRDDVQGTPPPPQRHPIIHHFVRAGLCRAEIKQVDQFQPSSYQFGEYWAVQSPGSHGIQIDRIHRDAVPVGTSATSLLLTCATLPDNVRGPPPPPPRHPIIHHFGYAGLCRAEIKHIDQFQP